MQYNAVSLDAEAKEQPRHTSATVNLRQPRAGCDRYPLSAKADSDTKTMVLAEGVGFEPTVTRTPRRFSRPLP